MSAPQIVIVTGSASGIGAATKDLFVQAGDVVIGADLADQAPRADPSTGFDVRLDVGSSAQWDALVEDVQGRFGRIDVFVNCAGYLKDAPLLALEEADLRRHLDTNVVGAFLGMRAVARVMTARGSGTILNVASVSGAMAHPGRGAYAASKWAARGLAKTAALEWAPQGVRVCTLLPGPIDTPMSRQARGFAAEESLAHLDLPQVPLRRFGRAAEVASLIAYLASPAAAYITGAEFVIDGGFLLT